MSFLQPMGLLLALALPLIIILHFRKQQVAEKNVSTLMLWNQVLREVQGVKTRSINRRLLLLLQLLIGALLVLALARPVWIASWHGEEVTIALDCSLSMQAVEGGATRLAKAGDELTGYLATLPDDVRINLVLLQKNSRLVLEKASPDEVVERLARIACTSEVLDMETAAGVLNACPAPRVVITDKELPLGDKRIKVGEHLENMGITGGTYDYHTHAALCRVKNYASADRTVLLQLEDDRGRRDVQKVDIPAGREADVNWPRLDTGAQLLRVTIQNQDLLAVDNSFLLPVGDSFSKKVLLVGESYYLQQALASLPGITVQSVDRWDGVKDQYDLYIINQEPPAGMLPAEARVWRLNPPAKMLGGQIDGPAPLTISPGTLARDLESDLQGAYVNKCAVLKLQPGYRVVMEAAGKPVMAAADRRLYSTPDWDNTNLTLLPAFPILVDNILTWFFQDEAAWLQPGDQIYPERDRALRVQGPQGFNAALEGIPVTLGRPGIYQIMENGQKMRTIIVNPPSGLVSGTIEQSEKQNKNELTGGAALTGLLPPLNLQVIILVLALVLLAVEWQVYRREL